jgi:hypothetical protein
VKQDLRFPRHSEQDEAMRAAFRELNELRWAEDQKALGRFLDQRGAMGEWTDALLFSRGMVRVTPGRLEEFFEEYLALLTRYTQPADSTSAVDARDVRAFFLAFPDVPDG